MANPFEVQVVNPLQALLTGAQAYKTTNDATQANNKRDIIQSAAQDYQNGNQQGALAKLLGVGAYQEASAINNITGSAADRARQARQDERQTGRDAVSDKFQAESLALQRRAAARADADKPIFKEVTDANGNTQIIRIMPQAGTASTVNTGIAPTAPANPFAYGKQNEGQSKDSGYANRLFDAEQTLRDPKVIEAGKSMTQTGLNSIPVVGQAATSPEYQKYDQAARNFINAVLRRESGAAISQSEFDNAYKQYIPRPFDSPERLAEKQKNRQATLASIAGGGGQTYRPPYTFGPNGEMVPTGAGKQGAAPQRAPIKVATPDDARKLPSGTPIILPDGTPGVVP